MGGVEECGDVAAEEFMKEGQVLIQALPQSQVVQKVVGSTQSLWESQGRRLVDSMTDLVAVVVQSIQSLEDSGRLRDIVSKTAALIESLAEDPEFIRLSRASIALVHRAARALQDIVGSLQSYFESCASQAALGDMGDSADGAADTGPRSSKRADGNSSKGWQKLRASVLESAVAKTATATLTRNGTALLRSVGSLGGLDGLVTSGSNLLHNRARRASLLRQLKSNIISFLLQYLPTVEVPVITGTRNNVEYRLEGITMSNIELEPENVELQLVNGQDLILLVRRSTFHIREFKWHYKQQSFPYLGSGGDADCFCACLQMRLKFSWRRLAKFLRISREGTAAIALLLARSKARAMRAAFGQEKSAVVERGALVKLRMRVFGKVVADVFHPPVACVC
eukprot:INCI5894.5.p1 GENE.INCI5894.5~~INCI5894.5.p1  ORF type:complete len:429 (-),score=72.39 INCI5894.5:33-1220(-)